MAGPLLRQCRAFVTLASLGSNDVTFFFFFFKALPVGSSLFSSKLYSFLHLVRSGAIWVYLMLAGC